jgi:hypothetical protein
MGTLQEVHYSLTIRETTLKAVNLQVERKRFNVIFKENALGRFVSLTKVGPRKYRTIILATRG